MRDPEVLKSWVQLGMVLGFGLAIVINCMLVWMALSLCRLKSTFGGMCMISAAHVLPSALLAPSYGWICSLGLMAFMVRSVTDAASWLDSIKFIFASMLISLVLVLLLVKLVFGSIDVREIMEERTALPVVSHGIQEEEDQPKQKPDRSSIDSLRAQLSPAELAEIRRQVEEPLEE